MRVVAILSLQLTIIFLLTSCNENKDNTEIAPALEENLTDISIDPSFDFKTEKTIDLNIPDNGGTNVLYKVYTVFQTESSHLVATGRPKDGYLKIQVVIPDYCTRLKLVRNNNGNETVSFLSVKGSVATSERQGFRISNTGCGDKLYAVNGNGHLYTIDLEGGDYFATKLPNLLGGTSYACAVDKPNGKMYYNTGQQLRYFDIDAQTFHTVHNQNPFGGYFPRMEYNPQDGYLYIADHTTLHKMDPITNEVIQTFGISGVQEPTTGGDLALSKDGTMYMCCFSGLYRLSFSGNQAVATRISAENFPYNPTSMAIDRNDRLYIATSDNNSHLIEMDKFDGAWNIVRTYNHKINDLGSFKCDISELPTEDSDNDGIIDVQDDYPDDATAAFNIFTPSDIGWGSLAFEDLWPNQGDYDFNDLVVSYRFKQVANADNEVVRLNATFKVKAIGAGYHNGFGFKMDIDPSLISSVTGYNHTNNIISTETNGLESGHSDGATIIVFDDAYKNAPSPGQGYFVNTEMNAPHVEADEIEVIIEFTNPISSSTIGAPPYNPFIFVRGDRGREVHLANYSPTDLANDSYFNTQDDKTDINQGNYYRTSNNLPWGINIIHEFRHPVERMAINRGYNKFVDWARGSGANYKDWYKDNSGYRNINRLYIR